MSKVISIESNIKPKLVSMAKYSRLFNERVMRPAFHLILDLVGQTSAAKYWITTSASSGSHILSPTNPSKPTMRTGRLLGSLMGVHRFSSLRLPATVERFAAQRFVSSGAGFERGRMESIRRVVVSGGNITAQIGTEVPYGEYVERDRAYLQPSAEEVAKGSKATQVLRGAVEGTFKKADI